jgi:hypothetical protein
VPDVVSCGVKEQESADPAAGLQHCATIFANSQLPAAWQAATHKRAAKVGHIEKGSSGGKPQMIALHLYPAAMASFA